MSKPMCSDVNPFGKNCIHQAGHQGAHETREYMPNSYHYAESNEESNEESGAASSASRNETARTSLTTLAEMLQLAASSITESGALRPELARLKAEHAEQLRVIHENHGQWNRNRQADWVGARDELQAKLERLGGLLDVEVAQHDQTKSCLRASDAEVKRLRIELAKNQDESGGDAPALCNAVSPFTVDGFTHGCNQPPRHIGRHRSMEGMKRLSWPSE